MTFWAYYDIITIRVIFMEKLKKYFKNKDNLIAIGLIFLLLFDYGRCIESFITSY